MHKDDLDNRFTYYPPQAENQQAERYQQIRAAAREFAGLVNDLTDDSREKSLAITHIEEAVFWANASIARHE